MGTFMTQHVRWQRMLENQRERLREGMEDDKRDFMVEHWNVLDAIDYQLYLTTRRFRSTTLSFGSASTMAYSFPTPSIPIVPPATKVIPGRKEICPGRRPHFHALHNFIISLLQSALASLILTASSASRTIPRTATALWCPYRRGNPIGPVDYD